MNTEDHNGYCISSFTNVTIKGVGINNENIIYGGLVATYLYYFYYIQYYE